jgi:hypothetical protein
MAFSAKFSGLLELLPSLFSPVGTDCWARECFGKQEHFLSEYCLEEWTLYLLSLLSNSSSQKWKQKLLWICSMRCVDTRTSWWLASFRLPVTLYGRTCEEFSIQEKELLSMIYALKKQSQYLFGMETSGYSDHSSLTSWETCRDSTGREARLVCLLSTLSVNIIYRSGHSTILRMLCLEDVTLNWI